MYLAIDWGKKRIGLAVGAVFPKGAGVIDGGKPVEQNIEIIKKIIAENEIVKIIVGLPMLRSGDEGSIATEIRAFAGRLSDETGLPVEFEPEEFTSVDAAQQFKDFDKDFSRKSGKLDEMAAVLILEQYLGHT